MFWLFIAFGGYGMCGRGPEESQSTGDDTVCEMAQRYGVVGVASQVGIRVCAPHSLDEDAVTGIDESVE